MDTEYIADQFDCVRDIRDGDAKTIEVGNRIFALCDKIRAVAQEDDPDVGEYLSALATNIMDTTITLPKDDQLTTVKMLKQMAVRLEMNIAKS